MPKLPVRLPLRSQTAERAIQAALDLFRRRDAKPASDLADRAADALKPVARKGLEAAEAVARKSPDALEASLRAVGRSRKTQAAPAVLLITGAGVAFWWWTQWARGRAESEAAAERDKEV